MARLRAAGWFTDLGTPFYEGALPEDEAPPPARAARTARAAARHAMAPASGQRRSRHPTARAAAAADARGRRQCTAAINTALDPLYEDLAEVRWEHPRDPDHGALVGDIPETPTLDPSETMR
jgi:NAD(P)H-dependent FMN reductase